MLTSMTGFGRVEVTLPSVGPAAVEIHTLNHRFLEVEVRLPEGFQAVEEPIRTTVARRIRRGRVRVLVVLKSRTALAPAVLQVNTARRYTVQLRKLQRELKLIGGPTLEMIVGLPQVVVPPERNASPHRWWPSLRRGVDQALSQVVRMRREEGERLESVLTRLIRMLEHLTLRIKRQIPKIQVGLRQRLARRIRQLTQAATRTPMSTQSGSPDWAPVIAEAASLVQAGDVSEELARIDSHLVSVRKTLEGQEDSPGRTLDFLAQELHREASTLAAKVREGRVVRWVVAMKNQIEKLREQAANVE